MRYREFLPGDAVRGYIVRFWTMQTGDDPPPGMLHRVLPDGCADLILIPAGGGWRSVVRGPRETVLEVPVWPHQRFWGIRFWPDAAPGVLGAPAARLAGAVEPAEPFLGEALRDLTAGIPAPDDEDAVVSHLDAWWTLRLATPPPLDASVRLALVAIHAGGWALGSEALGRLVLLSPRQLQRRFRRATGLTLKTYARIRRLRGAIDHLLGGEPVTWSRVAANLGYADQSHLVSEFSRLAGTSPTEVARYVSTFEHQDVGR